MKGLYCPMMSNELRYDPDTGHVLAGISCVKAACAWWSGGECAILTIARMMHNNREDALTDAEREHYRR